MANAALRKRGSLLIWVNTDMTSCAPRDGRTGRPAVFSDAAIQFCLSIKLLFKLLVDSTGTKFLDDGEWQAREHGVRGRRQ